MNLWSGNPTWHLCYNFLPEKITHVISFCLSIVMCHVLENTSVSSLGCICVNQRSVGWEILNNSLPSQLLGNMDTHTAPWLSPKPPDIASTLDMLLRNTQKPKVTHKAAGRNTYLKLDKLGLCTVNGSTSWTFSARCPLVVLVAPWDRWRLQMVGLLDPVCRSSLNQWHTLVSGFNPSEK